MFPDLLQQINTSNSTEELNLLKDQINKNFQLSSLEQKMLNLSIFNKLSKLIQLAHNNVNLAA